MGLHGCDVLIAFQQVAQHNHRTAECLQQSGEFVFGLFGDDDLLQSLDGSLEIAVHLHHLDHLPLLVYDTVADIQMVGVDVGADMIGITVEAHHELGFLCHHVEMAVGQRIEH